MRKTRGGFVLLIMCELSVILLVHKLLKRSKSVNNKNSNILIQTTVKPVLTWPTKQTLTQSLILIGGNQPPQQIPVILIYQKYNFIA